MSTAKINTSSQEIISKIIAFRKEQALSHTFMSQSLGISISAYNKIENLKSKLTVDRLFQIQKILKVNIQDLFNIQTQNVYNQEIHDNQIGLQHVENLYQENKEMAENYIKSLKEEVNFLKTLLEQKSN